MDIEDVMHSNARLQEENTRLRAELAAIQASVQEWRHVAKFWMEKYDASHTVTDEMIDPAAKVLADGLTHGAVWPETKRLARDVIAAGLQARSAHDVGQ